MQLTAAEKTIVLDILSDFSGVVLVFGSRARGTARPDSDLDLCFGTNGKTTPLSEMARLREAFENSSLPFTVDLVDFSQLPPDFQTKIIADGVAIK